MPRQRAGRCLSVDSEASIAFEPRRAHTYGPVVLRDVLSPNVVLKTQHSLGMIARFDLAVLYYSNICHGLHLGCL